MTRIRYEQKDIYLYSTKLILVGTTFMSVTINTTSFEYFISSPGVNESIVQKIGKGSSLISTKIKVKRVLKELGANFQDEIRVRGNTEKL